MNLVWICDALQSAQKANWYQSTPQKRQLWGAISYHRGSRLIIDMVFANLYVESTGSSIIIFLLETIVLLWHYINIIDWNWIVTGLQPSDAATVMCSFIPDTFSALSSFCVMSAHWTRVSISISSLIPLLLLRHCFFLIACNSVCLV